MVITDEGFRLPSISAKAAVETAEKLLEWCSQPENSNEFELFATNLIEELDSCFGAHRCRKDGKSCGRSSLKCNLLLNFDPNGLSFFHLVLMFQLLQFSISL